LTLEESKGLLGLDKNRYKELRDIFMEICQANGVVKKTLCRPEQWPFVKEELINRIPHLQTLFRASSAGQLDPTREPMALDLICMDVTKRIRTAGSYTSLIIAKNLLGLTPDDARDVRAKFDAILKADHFTGKLGSTREHWEGLKQKWVEESPRLQQEFHDIGSQDVWQQKHKALESIARDVQKRNRDFQTKNDPTFANYRKKTREVAPKPKKVGVGKETRQKARQDGINVPQQVGSEGHTYTEANGGRMPWMPSATQDHSAGIASLASRALANEPSYMTEEYRNLQIDPSLLEAIDIPIQAQAYYTQSISAQQALLSGDYNPVSIYIRLSPLSIFKHPNAPRVWLATLHGSLTFSNLRTVISNKLGLGQVTKIEGLADGRTMHDGGGSKWGIDEDDELGAYLAHVAGGKATFVVEVA
ncbi:MAG: hypothetical protein Q9163_006524, partial [Psora crenata]